jgi:predicted nucleic acid-binding protein
VYYVDTSVIVARYKSRDPLRAASERFFARARGARWISPLTLAELHAVYGRHLDHLWLPAALRQASDAEKVEALVLASVTDCALSPVAVSLTADWVVGEHRISVPLEYVEGRKLAPRLGLRALDLLHVAYCSMLRKTGIAVREFVTGDEELVARSKQIERTVGVRVSRPEEARGSPEVERVHRRRL